MRSPEELDTIDWPSLGHACGNGSDVPGWIRALYSDDRDQAHTAVVEFFGRALDEGSVSSAAVAAVPFLAHAAMHTLHEREAVLAALAGCGGTGAEPAYDDEVQGCARIAAEVTGLLHLLRDGDPLVRRTMVRVARRATGETVPAVLRELATCYASDPDTAVRAEALTVLTLLDPDEDTAHRRLRSALTDPRYRPSAPPPLWLCWNAPRRRTLPTWSPSWPRPEATPGSTSAPMSSPRESVPPTNAPGS
ncbi:HEAT repeat domain-containing protein [Kitasatospora sp. NPDC093102]|uniref:HEAT repeat domain-containing protein n=1 Tax=Kitasatospora sp. NPDC093102 TaxID=3155069 RepID=UPI00341B1E08